MGFINWLSQVVAVTSLNMRNLPSRATSSVVSIIGIAGVVSVFVAVLSIGVGFKAALESAGRDDNVIVMRGGSQGELSSILSQEQVRIISGAEGLANSGGKVLASSELFVVVDIPKKSTGTRANVPLRGVEDTAFEIRDGLEITKGRRFTPGLNEIIAGRSAQNQFAGLEIGSKLVWGNNEWTVVGIFSDNGSAAESELWTDLRVIQSAYNRGTVIQTVHARLASIDSFQEYKDALTTDPRLNVTVERETEFFAEQSRNLSGVINSVGVSVAILMGIGAIFGAILTMYSSVSARSREIATLRALGYGAFPVVISVFIEALLLGLFGGIIGAVLAFVGFNGYQASTLNWDSFAQVSFAFRVTPILLQIGIIFALLMGFVGGLLPAIRAARMPITAALREL